MKFFYVIALLLAPSMTLAAPAEEFHPLVDRGIAWTGNAIWAKSSTKLLSTTICPSLATTLKVTNIKQVYTKLKPNVWVGASPFGSGLCGKCYVFTDKVGSIYPNMRVYVVDQSIPPQTAPGAIIAMNYGNDGGLLSRPLTECLL